MITSNFIITIVSILVGALVSYLISRYFFKKTTKTKSLTPYIDFTGRIFSIHDDELASDLSIRYRNVEVENLYQISLIFANDGDIPIKDIIEPLKVTISNKVKVLDYEIIDVFPEGIKIKTFIEESADNTLVSFNFKLLNSGDYFGCRFLIKSDEELNLGRMFWAGNRSISINEHLDNDLNDIIKVSITAPELPPTLDLKRIPFPFNTYSLFDWDNIIGFIIIGLISTTFGLCLSRLNDNLYLFNFTEFFRSFELISIFILIAWLIVLILGIIAIFLFFQSLPNIFKIKKNKSKFNYRRTKKMR